MKKPRKELKKLWIVNGVLFAFVLSLCLFKFIQQSNDSNKEQATVPVINQVPEITSTPEVLVASTKVPATVEPATDEKTSLELIFTGDILLSSSTLQKYKTKGLEGIISTPLMETMKKADFTMVNQEFQFSDRGTKMQDKQYTFRASPSYVSIFNNMGIDIVSLANNHTLDFGVDALMDTFDTLDKAHIYYVGAGENLNRAKKIIYSTINNTKIAFLAASRVIPVTDWNATDQNPGMLTTYDPTILIEQIKEANEQADLTIVYLHWGVELKEKPEEYQRQLARQYIDAGADLIIGSHPHCLQGIEYYKEKPIIYSLGNFIFGDSIKETTLIKASISSQQEIELSLVPCSSSDAFTSEVTSEEKKIEFYEYITSISYNITVDSSGKISK